MKPVLIFGAGQVAQVFNSYLFMAKVPVHSFVVDSEFYDKTNPMVCGVPVRTLGSFRIDPQSYQFLIGMSFKGLNKPRAEKYAELLEMGYEPAAFSADDKLINCQHIGRGTFIMEQNVVQPFAEIGDNCILWSGNHIGHHTKIGNHVFIASHAVIGGACEIGDYSFIGVNATIRDGVKIGPRCVIGAGALILSDCEADGVYSPGGTERSRVPSNRLRSI